MKRNLNSILVSALAIILVGCQMEKVQNEEPRRLGVDNDPCQARLQELGGQFLHFHLINRRMPNSLEELNVSPIEQLPPLECPVSKKRYTYVPYGLTLPGRKDYLVLYDAQPVHSGMRWGLLISAPPPGGKTVIATPLLITDEVVINAEAAHRQKLKKKK